jgi:hypothetical protein
MKNNKTPQQKGRDYEDFWAKKRGARKQPASGALPFWKLDVKNVKFLFSLKNTEKKSYSVKKEEIQEMVNAVYGLGGIGGSHIPVLSINIDGVEVSVLLTDDLIELTEKEESVFIKSKDKSKRDSANLPSLLRDKKEK